MDEKINELVDERVQEENWKDRIAFEYTFVRTQTERLGDWLNAVIDGREVNETGCPTEVFLAQYHSMSSYLACLELRIALSGIMDETEPQAEVTD